MKMDSERIEMSGASTAQGSQDACRNQGREDMRCEQNTPDACRDRGTPDERPIGRWGRMHEAFLKAKHPGLYRQLAASGSLRRHLADAEERAFSLLESLTAQMARNEGVTEDLKAEAPMAWVGRMNGIRARAEEIVRAEIINTL